MQERIWAIGYARVSTPKQAVEGESLELQAAHIAGNVSTHGWLLFPSGKVFHEPYSGATDDRPVYRNILRLIRANPRKVRYFVVKGIDRFSREGSLRYQQMKHELSVLGVELRDIGGVIQPKVNSLAPFGFSYEWSETSPSAISEIVLAETASHEKSLMLTRVVGAQIKLTQDGYHVGRPDDGYVAIRISVDGKKKYAQFPDSERAQFVHTMFSLRAEGTYSDREIVEQLNAVGYRTRSWNRWDDQRTSIIGRRPGKPLTIKQLQRIIQNPIYCGVICEKWTHDLPVRAKGGESIVSIDLFNRANRGKRFVEEMADGGLRLLYDYERTRLATKRRKFRRDFPFKNAVACSKCGKPLVASYSRGKSGRYFGAYHCARAHPRYAVPQAAFESAFRRFLAGLRTPQECWRRAELVFRNLFATAQAENDDRCARTNETIQRLEEKKTQLVDAFSATASPIVRGELERQAEVVAQQIADAQAQQSRLGMTEADLEAFLSCARKLVEHPAKILENVRNLREQLALYGLLFARLPTPEEIANGTPSLTAAFRTIQCDGGSDGQCMTLPSLEWNTLHGELEKWKKAQWALDLCFERIAEKHASLNEAA